MNLDILATGSLVHLRRIRAQDLQRISEFAFTVSINEPHSQLSRLQALHSRHGFWEEDAGAVAIAAQTGARLLGTMQFYRPGPCVHGFELGYIIHNASDRGHGYAAESLRLFSALLFNEHHDHYRQQLMIEVWNTASWKVAERCGFLREGVLRSSGLGAGDPADSFVYSRTRKDHFQEHESNNGAQGHGHGG